MALYEGVAAADSPEVIIKPQQRWSGIGVKELWDCRELLYFLVWRDVKVRYKQTAIGASWAVIQPLITMVLFTAVFSKLAGISSEDLPYPIFSFAALVPWTYFSRSLNQSITSVVGNAHLITKVYFPRLLLPISAVVGGLIDFAIAFVFLLGMMAWYRITPTWGVLLLPVLILFTMLTALAVSVWLSVLNVRYRDVGQAIPFLVQLWLFASPVAYPLSEVSERWRVLLGLNPMTGVIEGFRWALLGKQVPDTMPMVLSATVVLLLLVSGVVYFRRVEATFADVV
jgi:lipopolysaccharide transport system permease protein